MKLFYSPIHSFVHKVLVTAHETGHWGNFEIVAVYPFRDGDDDGNTYSLAAIHPLSKVPTLALDDGTVIYGSQAVVEYFDMTGTAEPRLYPPAGPERWEVLTRLALGDTIFENTVMLSMESRYSDEERHVATYEWIWPKLIRGLDTLEHRVQQGFRQFDIGQASMLHALSYLALIAEFDEGRDPVQPNFDWTDSRPNLKAWWDETIQRPSVTAHFNQVYEGDDSPANCQAKVQEVLAAQRAAAG